MGWETPWFSRQRRWAIFELRKRRQDRRTPNYLTSTEAVVFSHSIRIVQVLPF